MPVADTKEAQRAELHRTIWAIANDRAVGSSPQMRGKKDLIDAFVASLTADSHLGEDWGCFVAERRETELDRIIAEERLKPNETRRFVAGAFRDGTLQGVARP